MLDETHDPRRRSWVPSAQAPDTDFPLQNLPLGAFRTAPDSRVRIGVAIGEEILDVRACLAAGLLDGPTRVAADACTGPTLNPLLSMAPEASRSLRSRVSHLLADDVRSAEREAASRCLLRQADVELVLPVAVGDYSDFYASIHHATNVGRMMRPDNPLLPNYRWVPIGYHGRASSLLPSGTPVARPRGQMKADAADAPEYRREPASRLRARARGVHRRRQPGSARRPPRRTRTATCSACAWSTTGRRATSRRGSTNHWGPSWPRASPRRSRPGS